MFGGGKISVFILTNCTKNSINVLSLSKSMDTNISLCLRCSIFLFHWRWWRILSYLPINDFQNTNDVHFVFVIAYLETPRNARRFILTLKLYGEASYQSGELDGWLDGLWNIKTLDPHVENTNMVHRKPKTASVR